MKKCGYVALVGRPNAGKSTLLNAVIGTKISVVSAKPQTTRNSILGVHSQGDVQLLFLDSPGMHNAEGLAKIHRLMNKAAWSVLADANFVCYLIDLEQGWHAQDEKYLQGVLEKAPCKVVVLATKADKLKKDFVFVKASEIETKLRELLETIEDATVKEKLAVPPVKIISAKRPEDLEDFRTYLGEFMPESPWYYSEDDLTDKPERFVCGELIREQVFRKLHEELPYNCAVKVDAFNRGDTLIKMKATIIVQKESHKGMVIGKKGSKLKEIGTEARKSLELHLGIKVFLELYVKVEEGWLDDVQLLAEYAALGNKE